MSAPALKGKKRKMLTFKIDEISGVDRAAQVPARAVLMKRDSDDDLVRKISALTSAANGHTHLLRTQMYEGGEMKSGETSYVDGHFHPWIRGSDGTITIGEASGHSHEVSVVSKKEDIAMTDAEKLALEKAQKDAADATKRAERAEKVLKLPVEQRGFFEKLDATAQDAFLEKTEDVRKAEVTAAVAKAGEADPVVFTSADGTAFRKSDDPRLVAMAKRNDADRAELTKATNERITERLEKRAATELNHLPGDSAAKVELLKALDAVPADKKVAVAEIIKAANSGLGKAFERAGTTGAADTGDAEAKLEKMAKELAAKTPGKSFAKAYSEVLETPEGAELYAQHQEEREQASA